MNYYIRNKTSESGPFTEDQVRSMWNDARFTSSMEYRLEDMDVWMPASDLAEDFNSSSRKASRQNSIHPASSAARYSNIKADPPSLVSPLTVIGSILIIIGFSLVVYFTAVYDTSVHVESTYISGYGSVGGGRVQNVGLLSNRQNGIMIGIGISVIGVVLLATGVIKNRKNE